MTEHHIHAQTELAALFREGRPEAALLAAREILAVDSDALEARLLAGLALLDMGQAHEAREILAQHFELRVDTAPDVGETEIADVELDSAFAEATTETDQILDANQLAEAAARTVDGGRPEGLLPDPRFETPTMASLLERQGLSDEAEHLRSAMRAREGTEGATTSVVIETLERWLLNLRRAYR
jgi:hypothetical protein